MIFYISQNMLFEKYVTELMRHNEYHRSWVMFIVIEFERGDIYFTRY